MVSLGSKCFPGIYSFVTFLPSGPNCFITKVKILPLPISMLRILIYSVVKQHNIERLIFKPFSLKHMYVSSSILRNEKKMTFLFHDKSQNWHTNSIVEFGVHLFIFIPFVFALSTANSVFQENLL